MTDWPKVGVYLLIAVALVAFWSGVAWVVVTLSN